jgi:NADH:ubiquinone oxidoreductase subunit 5 (subunit L)/multisubunit Na+/H+ antiporter MnhA subunit
LFLNTLGLVCTFQSYNNSHWPILLICLLIHSKLSISSQKLKCKNQLLFIFILIMQIVFLFNYFRQELNNYSWRSLSSKNKNGKIFTDNNLNISFTKQNLLSNIQFMFTWYSQKYLNVKHRSRKSKHTSHTITRL